MGSCVVARSFYLELVPVWRAKFCNTRFYVMIPGPGEASRFVWPFALPPVSPPPSAAKMEQVCLQSKRVIRVGSGSYTICNINEKKVICL